MKEEEKIKTLKKIMTVEDKKKKCHALMAHKTYP